MKLTPKPGEVCVVDEIPACNFCGAAGGRYDFRTGHGSRWANGCESCWREHAAEPRLGVGYGQIWITRDEVAS